MTNVLLLLFLEIILEISWPQTITNIHIEHSHSILKIPVWWWTRLVQLKLWFLISIINSRYKGHTSRVRISNCKIDGSQDSVSHVTSIICNRESDDVIKIQKFNLLRIRRNKLWFQPLASKGSILKTFAYNSRKIFVKPYKVCLENDESCAQKSC